MAEKVVTKKSFIGGHMVYPGEIVDVDAKGDIAPAASTPIGNLTVDQLRSALSARETSEKKREPEFGKNVADATEENTGSQPLAMAPVAPFSAGSVQPQGIPPGTEPHMGGFVHPAPEEAPVAIEEVVSADPSQSPEEDDGGDGKGSKRTPAPKRR